MLGIGKPRYYRNHIRCCLAGVAFLTIVPAPTAQAGEFPPVIALSSLNGTTGFRLDGVASKDYSGMSVASAGDVNGDGFADVIVGAPGAIPYGSYSGSSYVVFGKATGIASAVSLSSLDGTNGFRLDGAAEFDLIGTSVASAGDINGDGFADVIVGAWGADPHGSVSGASYVVFGKASGYGSAVSLSSLDGANGFRLDGAAAVDFSGFSVASAGDVNGDGFADIIVGAFGADPRGSESGASYVVFGRMWGFASVVSLSSLDGTNGFRLDGAAASDRSGRSVAPAGDVNGDGFADVIIGAYLADHDPFGALNSGSSYVVFGKAQGFASVVALSSLNGTTGFRLDGIGRYAHSGFSVAPAGDVNGDGFADVIVGAPRADQPGLEDCGLSYVVFGKAAGFVSALSVTSLDGTTGFRLDGPANAAESGSSVASAGDVNGDGFADVIIGAPGANSTGYASGSSYVVFGKASGFTSTMSLSSLDGANGFRLDGVAASDRSGFSVASAGDVNGDGFADAVVGAYGANPNGLDSGSSYVVFGRAPAAAVTRVGGAANQYISGGRFNDRLASLNGIDVLEGRRGADVLNGGLSSDTASYAHAAAGIIASLAAPAGNTGDAKGDIYLSVENLTGSQLADTLTGNSSANRITGLAGKDRITGGGGPDIFAFERLTDSIVGAARDVIVDFDAGTAATFVDRIDLRAIDAKTGVPGNQAFTFIGAAPFSHVKGELRVSNFGATAIISGDVDGDARADFQIHLLNVTDLTTLTAGDFLR